MKNIKITTVIEAEVEDNHTHGYKCPSFAKGKDNPPRSKFEVGDVIVPKELPYEYYHKYNVVVSVKYTPYRGWCYNCTSKTPSQPHFWVCDKNVETDSLSENWKRLKHKEIIQII